MDATRSEFSLGGRRSATLEVYPELDSTNAEMRRRFVDEEERFIPYTSIATTSQTAGKGRHDRTWIAPAGCTLALSVYVEFAADAASRSMGWVSLAAGLALREVLVARAPELAERIGVKWPNDVQIDGKKVAGILGDLLGVVDGGRAFACVVGIGVNTAIPEPELPTAQATSLQLEGLEVDALELAPDLVRALASRIDALSAAAGDAGASQLRNELLTHCDTVGTSVRVTLAEGVQFVGDATGIDASGQLEVRDSSGTIRAVSAGDIEHVRPAIQEEQGQ